MKKRWFHRVVSLGLALTMVVGLTACGKSGEETNGGGIGVGSNKKNPNAELAKQYVFSEEALEMPELGDDYSIRMLKQVGDKIYALMDIYSYSEEGDYESSMQLVSWAKDGTGMQVAEMQTVMGGEEAEADNRTEAEAEDTVSENSADSLIGDMSIYGSEVYESTNIGNCVVSQDGILYGVKEYYYEDYRDPENIISKNEVYLCSWTMDGIMQWETPIEGLRTDESWAYIQTMFPTADGKLMMLISGDEQEIMEATADGKLSERKPLSVNSDIFMNVSNMFVDEEGILNIVFWDQSDNYLLKMTTYDIVNDVMSEPVKLPDVFTMAGFNQVAPGVGCDMVYTATEGIFSYNLGDEQPTQILSYINSDMATTSINNFLMLDEEHLICFYYDNVENKTRGGIFTKVAPEDIKDKNVLVLAGFYVNYDVKNQVIKFNKSNENYRIVVKEYQNYSTTEDYMAGYTQLNNDIISGNMPDILIADNSLSMDNYISKGLLADVEALIAQDEELSQKEYMENVFEAYKVDGKLYYLIPAFYVRTMIGKEAVVGDRDTWTMKDAMTLMDSLSEETQLIGDSLRSDFLYKMMQYCGSDFVDVSTGKCSFDSQGFIDMLNYAATLPEEFGEDYWGEDYWMNYESQYRDDRTVLMECYVSSARDMNRNINGYFGEEISYIGFPTESGKGSVLTGEQMFAFSAKSESLEGAWEFARYYLSDEYQNEETYNLPITKEAFMKKANEAMEKPYYFDENGEKVEYEENFYINGESMPLPNMSQQQLDEFVAFIESVDKKMYYNEQILNIITEEADAFFSGQKSANDVAGIIQSRVQIYVNENM